MSDVQRQNESLYHRQNCPGTHGFDEVMCTVDFEGFFGTPSAQIF